VGNPTPWVGKAPNLVGTAPHLVCKAPHLVGKAPHLVGKAPHLVGKAPHLVGKKHQKPSDGDKALPMTPKADLAWESSALAFKKQSTLAFKDNLLRFYLRLRTDALLSERGIH